MFTWNFILRLFYAIDTVCNYRDVLKMLSFNNSRKLRSTASVFILIKTIVFLIAEHMLYYFKSIPAYPVFVWSLIYFISV